MNLPDEFIANMSDVLKIEMDEFIKSYDDKSYSGLRVNTSKISVADFMKIAPYKLEPVSYIDNGFYIDDADAWCKHPYYYAGLYYIQEPSAMLPANRLFVKEGAKVLDLCAAPGGKSTELITKDVSVLVSNDISFTRTIPLVKNLEMTGRSNLFVTCEDPSKLSNFFMGYFDSILVDAPCSGEGMFRKDPSLIKSWEKRKPCEYVEIQKKIIDNAYKMLAPGGYLMYSTCTFSPLEDELVIKYLLDKYDDINIEKIESIHGEILGYDDYVKGDIRLGKCVHILPHRVKGEGHFMSLLKKSDIYDDLENIDIKTDKISSKNNRVKKHLKYGELPDAVTDFLCHINKDMRDKVEKAKYLIDDKGFVYMLPIGYEDCIIKGIRYVRTGILVGETDKKGKFKPHTGFALSLKSCEFDNVISFDVNDINTIKYLKGETLIVDNNNLSGIRKGYVLVCVDDFALGFAKFDGNKFKNLYEQGWRMT